MADNVLRFNFIGTDRVSKVADGIGKKFGALGRVAAGTGKAVSFVAPSKDEAEEDEDENEDPKKARVTQARADYVAKAPRAPAPAMRTPVDVKEPEMHNGDFVIDARGSSALVERDLQAQALPQARRTARSAPAGPSGSRRTPAAPQSSGGRTPNPRARAWPT